MPKRVLYVCGARGFSKKYSFRKLDSVAQCWRREGHEVTHVYGGDIDGVNLEAMDYGSDSFFRKWYRNYRLLDPFVNSVSEFKDIQHNIKLAKYISDVSSQVKPDIIWERSSRLHFAGLDVARWIGIPYVLEWKDNLIPYSFSLYNRRALSLENRKNHEADYIVVESNVLKDGLVKEGVDSNKIFVAHNAVDTDQFFCDGNVRGIIRQELGVGDNEVLVGYLGSYAFYHDTIRLVLAADLIRQQGDKKIKILMVGAGKELPEARRMADNLKLLGDNLIMKSGVSLNEVPRILSAIDIAVLPGSTDIICPIKIQEYMATELALIAPDYPCNREVVSHTQTGMLFEPKNEKSLSETILFLADNSVLRAEMGRRARCEILERFTWKKTWGTSLQEILQRVKAA